MPRTSKALRDESARMRDLGWSYRRIALELARQHRLNARVAYRLAHGWTQEDVARRWNERWPGEGTKTGKTISYWELWPARGGREPSARTLARLAALYQCRPGDLLDGLELDGGAAVGGPVRAPLATAPGRRLRGYRQEAGGAFDDGHAAAPVPRRTPTPTPPVPGSSVLSVSDREGAVRCDGSCGDPFCGGDGYPDHDLEWVRAPAMVMVHQNGPEPAGRADGTGRHVGGGVIRAA